MVIIYGLSALVILIFMGRFYYHFSKNTADEFIQEYIEEKQQIKKEGGRHGENSDCDRAVGT
jgi:hypothetical protein